MRGLKETSCYAWNVVKRIIAKDWWRNILYSS